MSMSRRTEGLKEDRGGLKGKDKETEDWTEGPYRATWDGQPTFEPIRDQASTAAIGTAKSAAIGRAAAESVAESEAEEVAESVSG